MIVDIKDHFRNLGAIARMNHKSRVPAHDSKVLPALGQRGDIKASVLLREWQKGWDEINLEYAKYLLQR